MRHITSSEKQTFNFAKKLAKTLRGGEVIGLVGDLGAGKTIFAKGLAAGLGIKKRITSPTFVIMKIYEIKNQKPARNASPIKAGGSKIKNFTHIDAYRLKSARDLIAIGAKDYLGRSDTVSVIEWADKVMVVLPKKTMFVNIKSQKNNKRIICRQYAPRK